MLDTRTNQWHLAIITKIVACTGNGGRPFLWGDARTKLFQFVETVSLHFICLGDRRLTRWANQRRWSSHGSPVCSREKFVKNEIALDPSGKSAL